MSTPSTFDQPGSVSDPTAPGQTGWTRELVFSDRRCPRVLWGDLEQDWTAPFEPSVNEDRLHLRAELHHTGVCYRVGFEFLSAGARTHRYRLTATASWAGCAPQYQDYFQKTSASWFELWTRELKPLLRGSRETVLDERYTALCRDLQAAHETLSNVASIRLHLVEAMKAGATFAAAHKEGGSTLQWFKDRYLLSHYGERTDVERCETDDAFLAMLWRHYYHEVTRHAGTQGQTEAASWRLIYRQLRRE